MVAVSADIVEISGSIQKTRGFSWNQYFDFTEKTIPGIITLGDFERKTQLTASLKLLETEGKAQILSNPKVITKSGAGNFCVGGGIGAYSTTRAWAPSSEIRRDLVVLPWYSPRRKIPVDVQISSRSQPGLFQAGRDFRHYHPSMVTARSRPRWN